MGQSNNPITLHKYLYANPVMYTDPSGYMSLGGINASFNIMTNLASRSVTLFNTASKVSNFADGGCK